MTAQQMTLRPGGAEPKRRGRPSKAEVAAKAQARQAMALLAGMDALTVSSQGRVSAEVYSKLREAKEAAKHAEHSGTVHCPEWLSAQVKPKIVSEMLGHSTVSMTLDTYSHVLPDMQRDATEAFDRLFGPE